MKNISEVREQLSAVFEGLKNGSVTPQVACELNNSAGKIINSLKVELEYYALRKETPTIRFLAEPAFIDAKRVEQVTDRRS